MNAWIELHGNQDRRVEGESWLVVSDPFHFTVRVCVRFHDDLPAAARESIAHFFRVSLATAVDLLGSEAREAVKR